MIATVILLLVAVGLGTWGTVGTLQGDYEESVWSLLGGGVVAVVGFAVAALA